MRRFRKIVRAVILTLLILVVAVPSGVYVVLSTPWGRQKVCDIATTQLSELLGTKVYIGNLVYHPFNTLVLNHIRVNDDNGATALQAARISARFELWNFLRTGRLDFDYAVIDAPFFQLYRATPDGPLNISGIIARLQPKDKNKPPSNFDLRIGTVVLSKGRFSYDVLSEPIDSTGTFNKNHINVSRLDLRAYLRHGSPDSWDAALEKFSMVERSGLTISDITADVLVTPRRLALRSFSLKLPGSSFALQPLDLRINGYASITDIITSRSLLLRPQGPVIIATSDLACFSPILGQIDRTFTATFDIDASMRKVNINNLEVSDQKGLDLEITGSVSHLDQPDSVQFNILRLSLKAPAASTAPLLAAIRPQLAEIAGHTGDISLLGSGAGNLYGSKLDFAAAARGARLSFNGAVTTHDRYRSA
ncbi:MAG: AsmA family protein, partial [Muribaculaceae bacterium]|nr:AsmA family protein [Muribaculaceae bacterium]